jgi:hypothetical protein
MNPIPLQAGGRIPVEPDLTLPGHSATSSNGILHCPEGVLFQLFDQGQGFFRIRVSYSLP